MRLGISGGVPLETADEFARPRMTHPISNSSDGNGDREKDEEGFAFSANFEYIHARRHYERPCSIGASHYRGKMGQLEAAIT